MPQVKTSPSIVEGISDYQPRDVDLVRVCSYILPIAQKLLAKRLSLSSAFPDKLAHPVIRAATEVRLELARLRRKMVAAAKTVTILPPPGRTPFTLYPGNCGRLRPKNVIRG